MRRHDHVSMKNDHALVVPCVRASGNPGTVASDDRVAYQQLHILAVASFAFGDRPHFVKRAVAAPHLHDLRHIEA